MKDVRSQGGGRRGLSSAGILRTRQGGFFRCGRPHFLVQNTSDFSKLMVCPHGQWRLSQCGNFSDNGSNFSRFCADVLYGRLLIQNQASLKPAYERTWSINLKNPPRFRTFLFSEGHLSAGRRP